MSAKLSAREVLDRSIVVSLPLPDRRLSPNARVHWAERRAVTKQARYDAGVLAVSARNANIFRWMPADYSHKRIKLSITFTLPDNRRRDIDNLIAGCKAYFDGIADALGIDDSRFDIVKLTRTVVKGKGSVTIEVGA